MSGPEHKQLSEAEQNQKGLEDLKRALGQSPETQEAFAAQIPEDTQNRARQLAQRPHGTPGMTTRGNFNSDPYQRANEAGRPTPTTSAEGAQNVANHRSPEFRMNELRAKTNPNTMKAIEQSVGNIQNLMSMPPNTPGFKDKLKIAMNGAISVPSDFPITIPQDCKIPSLNFYK